ncbi:trypsin-like peptidase domain-containing protein [Canibacter sp. lx-45]|uniref:S1C family serine protease n=1 Tax=Canibacter zhuwentaonis TaxID=2837491 RepID=UPI001BDD5FC2|nr:trypsin-like peptidase domain-containing protein [Canibacter zhuwentaonis]MBT1034820.1 trypsin-like peptidase domain-containing protein [Canibacter zhuwentaonis]
MTDSENKYEGNGTNSELSLTYTNGASGGDGARAVKNYYRPHPDFARPEAAPAGVAADAPTVLIQDAPGSAGGNSLGGSTPGSNSSGGGTPGGNAGAQRSAINGRRKRSNTNKSLVTGILIGSLTSFVIAGGTSAVMFHNLANRGHSTVTQSGVPNTKIDRPAENLSGVSEIAAKKTKSVVTLDVATQSSRGTGSGVVYSADGYIITNAHVAAPNGDTNGKITVRMSDGKFLPAKLIGLDPYSDLAVVKVEANDLVPIEFGDSEKLNVGDLTVAIGAPLELPNTVTTGVVSALNRGISVGAAPLDDPHQKPDEESGPRNPWQYEFGTPDGGQPEQQPQRQQRANRVTLSVIQTDASINPGNSGGALLNAAGQLIGINVAIVSTGGGEGKTPGSVGLGFAIPSNMVQRVIESIIKGEKPSHGLLGASVADATRMQGATHAGGVITEVQPGSAAASAGLKPGDIITAINGVGTADGTAVSARVRMHAGGDNIKLTIIRDGKEVEQSVTLGTL